MATIYVTPGTDGIKVASPSTSQVLNITVGTTADKLGFYGLATPVVKPSLTTTNSTIASQVALVLSALGLCTVATS